MKRLNWPIWSGFLLSVIAFLSYFLVFVQFPITRDFPWANLILFAFAAALLFIGVRRAFGRGLPHPIRSKAVGVVVPLISVAIFTMFVLTMFVIARQLPPSTGAPKVGQRAAEFTLVDANGKSVSLSDLMSSPINGKPTKGVLLIFYRGYW